MKQLLNLSLAAITLTQVKAIEWSSLTQCANLAKNNQLCTNHNESCGKFLTKRAEKMSERNTFDYGCILTKWCNHQGVVNGVETVFECPYGKQDVLHEKAQEAFNSPALQAALADSDEHGDSELAEDCEKKEHDGEVIPGGHVHDHCRHAHYPAPAQMSDLKHAENSFGVKTVWDRLGRDGWLLLMWLPLGPILGLWQFQILPAFWVNLIGTIYLTEDENGNNFESGMFLFAEYLGAWGLNDYYNLYSQEGWWTMFGDWVVITLFWWAEPWIILILVAMEELSFGSGNEGAEEIAAAEAAAEGALDEAKKPVANARHITARLRYEEDEH